MEEATKYLLTQGILGVLAAAEGWVIFRLWRENRALHERLEAKSEKDSEKNRELAAQAIEAVRAFNQHQRKRRPTSAGGGGG